jgi:two-component system invasion response regulator UvrY
MTHPQKTSVILVDDHAVVRAGYKRYIELDERLSVVGEASTGEEAYALLEQLSADVVVMDLSMPGQGGFESLRRILNRYPQQKVLIFSMHENASIANQALRLGAVGYLTKSMAPDQIIAAIHSYHASLRYSSCWPRAKASIALARACI